MQISHETIYRALYVQARGSLRRELTRHLRTRRQKRFARAHSNRGQGPGRIAEMVMISERPPEVSDRAVPGHWEGDLLMGTRDSAIATLVERQTRYCQLVALPEGTNAEPVCEALKTSIKTLPVQLRRSLTWDQGKEMAEHRRFSVETGVEVYFCDPRSPWQRGSNENTNGLLRQYFPKGKSLAGVTQAELDEVARKLNDRPRQTLGFRTPAEKLTELIDGLQTGAPDADPRVAGAVARPGSHRTVRTLFVYGSSGRRVMTPAAGRFATSKSSPQRQLRRFGGDDVLVRAAVHVDQGHEPAFAKYALRRPWSTAGCGSAPTRTCGPDRPAATPSAGVDAQLDEVACDRSFAFPVAQQDRAQPSPDVGVDLAHICISSTGGDPEEPVPAAQPRVDPGDARDERASPVSRRQLADALHRVALRALRQQHLDGPGLRI